MKKKVTKENKEKISTLNENPGRSIKKMNALEEILKAEQEAAEEKKEKPSYESGGYRNRHGLENFFAVIGFFPEHHPDGLYGTCHRGSKAITIAEHTRRDIEQRELTKIHEDIHAVTGSPDGYVVNQLEKAVAGIGWPKDRYERGGKNY